MALLGAHVNQSDPITQAQQRGAQLAQIFIGDPQAWKGHAVGYPDGPAALKQAAIDAGIALVVHAPYVINVATANNRIRIPSRKMLQKQVSLAAEIGAIGVVVHGGHVSAGDDETVGYDNWRKCVDQLEADVPIFIENTAGGERAMARGVAKLERLWESVLQADGGDQVGLCLDTCHAYAGGEELAGLVDRVKAVIGRIDLVHANDSRDVFDSGADRHANLGEGSLPADDLVELVQSAGAPVVVETPGGAAEHKADLNWLRSRLG